MSGRIARLAWGVWHALLIFATLGLLSVIGYAAIGSPPEGPSAWPYIFTGLLILSFMVLAVLSLVDAVLWATAARWTWLRRLVLIPAVLVGGMLVFSLALWVSDSKNQIVSSIGLLFFALAVLVAHGLNRYAVHRFRATP
jgi:hypothetical protein